MRLKRPDKDKSERLDMRCTPAEKNAIRRKAALYCDGNLNEWVRYAALNFMPGADDLEDDAEEIKTPAKKPGQKKKR